MTTASEPPRVSILLATRNRSKQLARTLDALALLRTRDLAWEVVVVDNGSSDDTAATIRAAATSLPLLHLEEPERGKNHAINKGLSAARGELIVFTDDDCLPEPDWLQELVRAARRWPNDNIFGGAVRPRFPAQTPSWLSDPDFRHGRWAFSWYQPRADEGPTSETPLGPNMMIRASVLRNTRFDSSIGPSGSSYAMGSEVELLLRLQRSGEPFIYVPSAVVHHVLQKGHLERASLLRRAYRCGRGNARLFPGISTFPVFGIPVYHLLRLGRASLRMLVSPLVSQETRWIAAMDFHQARGRIAEGLSLRRAAAEQGAPYQHSFPKVVDIARAFRRRGVLGMGIRPLVAVARPLVEKKRVSFFCADRPPELPQDDHLEIRLYDRSDDRHAVRSALCRMEVLQAEEIEMRLALGHTVAIAFDDGRPVGYNWRAHGSVAVLEVDATLHLQPHEVVGYDGYVVPDYRGQRTIARLDAAQMRAAAKRGRTKQYVYAEPSNRSSLRSLERMGKAPAFSVIRLSVPPLGFSRLVVRGDAGKGRIVSGIETSPH